MRSQRTTPARRVARVEVFAHMMAMYVRVTTESGLQGVGEATYFAWPQAPAAIAEALAQRIIGRDVFDTETLGAELYRGTSFRGMAVSGAISALDQALWDLKGQHCEVPVWELLGGRVRDRVRAMLVVGYGTLQEVEKQAKEAVQGGYTALKIMLFQDEHHGMSHGARIEDMVQRLSAVRESVGWDVDLAVELHRNMGPADSLVLMSEIAKLRPIFVEDPIPPDSMTVLGDIARKAPVPIAACERNTTVWEFAEYAALPGVEFLRPDVGIAGGISGVRKVAAIAEARHQLIAPHAVPTGPVALAAQVHLGMALLPWWAHEYQPLASTPRAAVASGFPDVVDGHFLPPEEVGLGVRLVDEVVVTPPAPGESHDVPRRMDGSVGYR